MSDSVRLLEEAREFRARYGSAEQYPGSQVAKWIAYFDALAVELQRLRDALERWRLAAQQVVDADMGMSERGRSHADRVRLSQVQTEGIMLLAELVYPPAALAGSTAAQQEEETNG